MPNVSLKSVSIMLFVSAGKITDTSTMIVKLKNEREDLNGDNFLLFPLNCPVCQCHGVPV